MRNSAVLLLAAALGMPAACTDPDEPSTDGTLVVSTHTGGDGPDQDGYLLTVDGIQSLPLNPTGTLELGLPSGRHSLRLDGVAQHCSVVQGPSREVDVPSRGTASVAFEVSCEASSLRITTTTTGLDVDPDGYHVVVDGMDRGSIAPNGALLIPVDHGSRAIALTGLAPLCATDGPSSRAVSVTGPDVVSIDFTIVCTAASGVIGVLVEASGAHPSGSFEMTIDGAGGHHVGLGVPYFVDGVPGGSHIVSLRGSHQCSVDTESQPVTIAIGELVRDTVQVNFSVTCAREVTGSVRITAPTRGTLPSSHTYRVWYEHFDYWGYLGGVMSYLGDLEPNGTLVADLPVSTESGADPSWYRFYLVDIPETCRADDPHPNSYSGFEITFGDTLEVEFEVVCSP